MCILAFSLNRRCELLRANLTVKQRLPDCCWKESAAHMWVPKRCWGGKSVSGCLLTMAALNYLGTLVYEVSLQCIKASNQKGCFFLNSNLISTEINFIFPLTFRMQELSFSFFIPSFPFIRSIECWHHKNVYSSMLIFVTFYPVCLVNPGTLPIWCLSLSVSIGISTWLGACSF